MLTIDRDDVRLDDLDVALLGATLRSRGYDAGALVMLGKPPGAFAKQNERRRAV